MYNVSISYGIIIRLYECIHFISVVWFQYLAYRCRFSVLNQQSVKQFVLE